MALLHGHVEAPLDHRVLKRLVSSRADLRIRPMLPVVGRLPLGLEARALRVKNGHVAPEFLHAWLLERARPAEVPRPLRILWLRADADLFGTLSRVMAGARHAKLQRLTEEDLVKVEPRLCAIERNLLAREELVVRRPVPLGPARARVLQLVLDYVFRLQRHLRLALGSQVIPRRCALGVAHRARQGRCAEGSGCLVRR